MESLNVHGIVVQSYGARVPGAMKSTIKQYMVEIRCFGMEVRKANFEQVLPWYTDVTNFNGDNDTEKRDVKGVISVSAKHFRLTHYLSLMTRGTLKRRAATLV